MKVILVCPEFPDTFWSYKHALKFIDKKASLPPLGLLTVASLLPREWDVRLIDMNVSPLEDRDIRRADMVFIGAISVQKQAAKEVIARCRRLGKKVVAGGPLFTTGYDDFPEVDHLVLGEAEITLPLFLCDMREGVPQRLYVSQQRADVRRTPRPRWELIDLRQYASLNIQYSRGCPFDCEFCDITQLYGRESRTKAAAQVLAELEELYARGWRGPVFFVDDNFIGNRSKLKQEVLPAVLRWMQARGNPFVFNTQVSVNLADDPELMRLMTAAGFDAVFVGIETPSEASLAECAKVQNRRRDLLDSVKRIQQAGMEVQGGFIVGFDNDPPAIFDRQIAFIQESGIVTAMVGLLNALRGTRLYRRMEQESRLLQDHSGDNTDGTINFVPRMDRTALLAGYRRVLETVYAPRYYYHRIRTCLERYRPVQQRFTTLNYSNIRALVRSMVLLGVTGRERLHYWKLLFWTVRKDLRLLPQAVTFAIYGYHYRKVLLQRYRGGPVADGAVPPDGRKWRDMVAAGRV